MTDARGTRPLRIANFSGFFGDRASALTEMLRGGPVDVLTGDYLAEVTMLVLAKTRLKDPEGGYAASFLQHLAPVLSEIQRAGVKVVVNAGGLNPAGLAAAVRRHCAEAGVELNVAHVEGDDISNRLADLQHDGHDLGHLDTGAPLSSWGREPLTANAYLGAWGIVAALESGADIVICPRVADASLVVGPAAWWYDWSPDAWDALAGAVVAGHVIECGTQATGGNYSGFESVKGFERLGFPIAEVGPDGACVITKHPGSGGCVTPDTVTAQMLYEIQGLDYLNPDVTTRLDTIRLDEDGADRVRISGVRGGPPPPTTKVSITGLGGYENSATFVLTGLAIRQKAELVEATLRARCASVKGIDRLRFDLIGNPVASGHNQLESTCLLRVSVQGDERAVGRQFFNLVVELALANYPGLYTLGGDTRAAKSFGVYWPGRIAQEILDHRAVFHDGAIVRAKTPPVADYRPRDNPARPSPEDPAGGARVFLGDFFHARSGDKGGNANVGIWTHNPVAYGWARAHLTADRLAELMPEAKDLRIERFELPNLQALNFVIHDLLDGGATETMRFDAQAKALGEYVRSRLVEVPSVLLTGEGSNEP
ncbi:MAG: DUF1446 domain-containing protein [Phenylobacterium sp.]|uniref:acyclic terpene utilization AtuA family protein n=1 Tax=Phenylobacterium sp. TaxID=1871053 RepID=UPI001A24AF11|nr:acyclic terpene utilization AtuA family protein [Phenylobacterium sp.]MBJ7412235.1 DUF1446 domain-containing protein [Phenylobacterium sp.]